MRYLHLNLASSSLRNASCASSAVKPYLVLSTLPDDPPLLPPPRPRPPPLIHHQRILYPRRCRRVTLTSAHNWSTCPRPSARLPRRLTPIGLHGASPRRKHATPCVFPRKGRTVCACAKIRRNPKVQALPLVVKRAGCVAKRA